jgi:TorA maturation chaperone TorD
MGMPMNDELTATELANIAQARAALCSFLNLHFTTLLDASFVERMGAPEFASVLQTLAVDTTIHDELAAGASLMSEYLWQSKELPLPEVVKTLGVDRTRLYRSVSKGYGPPPPYEMVWNKEASDYSYLATIAGVYGEAGLSPSPEAKERLDYIGVELDFLAELARREAAAWEDGVTEDARKHLALQHQFMSQHFGVWAPSFIQKALLFAETDFYKGHLVMLRGFIDQQQEELGSLLSEG